VTRAIQVLVPGLWKSAAQAPEIQLPRMLARIMGRARPEPTVETGWETELAHALGFRQPAAGERRWLALPVTLAPGLTDLVATRVENLDTGQVEGLWAAAAAEMESAGATREERFPGLDLLVMAGEGRWEGLPPSVGLGRSMQALRLDSPLYRRLQVLANNLQMVWFDHPVNRERVAAGQAPVHGLWLWSPGLPSVPPTVSRVAGGGLLARWLAEQAQVPWSADPLDPSADFTVLDAFLSPRTPTRFSGLLQSLADDVLQSRVDHLRKDGSVALVLHDPGVARLRLIRRDWRRFWIRPRGLVPLPR
jgi:hypothetical protein